MNTGERKRSYPEPTPAAAELRDAATTRPWSEVERDEPSPEQIAIYRNMTPQRRLEIAGQMFWMARRWKTAGVRAAHPDWPEDQVAREVARIIANARS